MSNWLNKPITRVVSFAPGCNGCMLYFGDGTAFGLNGFQQQQYDPHTGDLFSLSDFGTVTIKKETKNAN
jgi:hypothetical protein